MRIYQRLRAVKYALNWALNRNKDFPDYSLQAGGGGGGGDCANFVSQALLAGGWPAVWGLHGDARSWWTSDRLSSKTWSTVDNLRWFIELSSRGSRCYPHELTFGDLVFIQRGENDSRAAHVMMVTDVQEKPSTNRHDPGVIRTVSLTYHSNNTRNKPLNKVALLSNASYFDYWKLGDLIPPAPLPNINPGPPPPTTFRTEIRDV
jgi:hypothetical protein